MASIAASDGASHSDDTYFENSNSSTSSLKTQSVLFNLSHPNQDGFRDKVHSVASQALRIFGEKLLCKPLELMGITVLDYFYRDKQLQSSNVNNTVQLIYEVAIGTLIFSLVIPTALALAPLYMLGIPLKIASKIIEPTRSFSIDLIEIKKGNCSEEPTNNPKMIALNPSMTSDFRSLMHEGLPTIYGRLPQLVKTIKDNSPDIIFLHGIGTKGSDFLYNNLKDHFSSFIITDKSKIVRNAPPFFVAFKGRQEIKPLFLGFSAQNGPYESGYLLVATESRYYIVLHNPSLADICEIPLSTLSDKGVVILGEFDSESAVEINQYLKKQSFEVIPQKNSISKFAEQENLVQEHTNIERASSVEMVYSRGVNFKNGLHTTKLFEEGGEGAISFKNMVHAKILD